MTTPVNFRDDVGAQRPSLKKTLRPVNTHVLFFRTPTMSLDFKTAVEQEVARLRALHPTPEDVPGCMKLLDDFLSCNGAPDRSHIASHLTDDNSPI